MTLEGRGESGVVWVRRGGGEWCCVGEEGRGESGVVWVRSL